MAIEPAATDLVSWERAEGTPHPRHGVKDPHDFGKDGFLLVLPTGKEVLELLVVSGLLSKKSFGGEDKTIVVLHQFVDVCDHLCRDARRAKHNQVFFGLLKERLEL